MRLTRAFTLIELLIVVAIIAILAAIAVPNFLEAQTRSKISRVKADIRSVMTALESYRVDNNEYPIVDNRYIAPNAQINRGDLRDVIGLSTPVAYLTSTNIADPFYEGTAVKPLNTLQVINIELYRKQGGASFTNAPWPASQSGFMVFSWGPDNQIGPFARVDSYPYADGYNYTYGGTRDWLPEHAGGGYFRAAAAYDPTNGTVSQGDIFRFVGQTD